MDAIGGAEWTDSSLALALIQARMPSDGALSVTGVRAFARPCISANDCPEPFIPMLSKTPWALLFCGICPRKTNPMPSRNTLPQLSSR